MNFGELKKILEKPAQKKPDDPEQESSLWIAGLTAIIAWSMIFAAFLLGMTFVAIDAFIAQKLCIMFFPGQYTLSYVQTFGLVLIASIVVETPQRSFENKTEALGFFFAKVILRPFLYIGAAWLFLRVFS